MTKAVRYASSFKSFYKACKKRYPNFVKQYRNAVELFFEDKSLVSDHQLSKRSLKGLRAFAVNSDIRVIYKETKNYYFFIKVGSHRQIYD